MIMADSHRKCCSTSLIIREMNIKTTIRYHLTTIRLGYPSKNKEITTAGEDVENWNPCTVLVVM